MSSRYCCFHDRHHHSSHWYSLSGGGPEFDGAHWCSAAYLRLVRLGSVRHPLWLLLNQQVSATDVTGRCIALLLRRADIMALRAADSMLRVSPSWAALRHRVWAIGFLLQAYWPEPMAMLLSHFLQSSPLSVTMPLLRSWWRRVARAVRGCRYLDGLMVTGSRGCQPMKNPSERCSGSVRYMRLARSMQKWRIAADRVALALQGAGPYVALRAVLGAMRVADFHVFSDSVTYANVRIARAIIVGCGYRIADTADDWLVLSRMSPSMRSLCRRWGLNHAAAIQLRDAVRGTYSEYSFLDLSCFLCLASL